MKKRIISIILAITIVMTSFSFTYNAYANSLQLVLDTKLSTNINGAGDLEWFYYTPTATGTYTIRSYNIYASEVYLFVREVDPVTKQKRMVQLAYSNSDDKTETGSRQFMLTYHLIAGTTYYFGVGWYMSDSRTSGVYTVMLTNDNYDESLIERIELDNPVALEAYTDGDWIKDSSGNTFFRYNISKIVSNLSITVHYYDGKSTTVVGQEYVDGYAITFINNQYNEHWYPNNSTEYNKNTFTVKINDVTASIDIPIVISSKYSVKGRVIDMNGNPVSNATIMQGATTLAVSADDGSFTFYHNAGQYQFTVYTTHSINRKFLLQISANSANNNFTSKPVTICNCDFVKDGIINAKDFSFINKYADEADKPNLTAEFRKCINFTAKDYI